MELSVVILNYNVRYFLELCVQSVLEAVKTLDAEVIVVDNNSSDDSCKVIAKKYPQVKLIQNTENYGFSKANNLAVKQAKGQYICILNPDTVVPEDVFTTILKFAKTKTNLGIIGCRLIDGTGKFLPESKRNIPTPYVALKKMLGKGSQYYATQLNEYSIGKIPVLVGAFMFLKKAVFQEVSGFDEAYFMYGEDIDLSYKIHLEGYQNYYYGEITCIHFKGESTLKDQHYAKCFYGAMQIFYKKHFKQNIFSNVLVWLGIKVSFLLRKKTKVTKISVNNYLMVGNLPLGLKEKLTKEIRVVSAVPDAVGVNTQVLLNSQSLTFKTIINTIASKKKKTQTTFKIIPKNSNYMLGSNSSQIQGEVVKF